MSKIQKVNWPNSKDILLMVEKKDLATSISKIDDYVKHIFREYNQEADHWANLGAKGLRKVVNDKGKSTERWEAVRAFWDGSSKINGRSGYGVVIKGVHRNKRITFSKIAVHLGIGTAMTAEVVGVCVFTGILDLVLTKFLKMKNVNQCIDAIIRNH